jgi:hypothetical protein
MSQQFITTTFPNGLVLNRYYESDYGPVDNQCGSIAQWTSWINQLGTNTYEYYNQPDLTNKFTRRVTVNVYSKWLPFPNANIALALTYSDADYRSHIDIQYFDPQTYGGYKFPAALSHEWYHAYHNWMGLYGNQSQGCEELAHLWERLISSNHTTYDPNQAPWAVPDGRHEGPWEQFANAGRFFGGTTEAPGNTRGSSGPGTPDGVIPGFEDPKNHPDWKLLFQWYPEACAMVKSYGIKAGSSSWGGNYLMFQVPSGTWVYMDGYNSWHWWNGYSWQSWSPSYNRI